MCVVRGVGRPGPFSHRTRPETLNLALSLLSLHPPIPTLSQATNEAFKTFNRPSASMISDMIEKRTLQCFHTASYCAHEVRTSVRVDAGDDGIWVCVGATSLSESEPARGARHAIVDPFFQHGKPSYPHL